MGILLPKAQRDAYKVKCFSCNLSFSKKRLKNPKKWLCPECQAENYLDNKGNIVDVPTHIVNTNSRSNIRYSVSLPKFTGSSPFCQTCLKNHSFIVNSLASYLPPDDDPDYHIYLSAFPSYKAFLEERYPMVCDLCSSRVQQHLAKKNYFAKSSVLGEWLLNSKKTFNLRKNQPRSFLSARLLIWGVRGVGWWIVTCSMTLYYILGFFIPNVFLKDTYQTMPFWKIKDFSKCITISFDRNISFSNCLFLYKLFIRKLILWSIFVILWDYTWISQILKPDHHVSGKNYYYMCQTFIYITRASAEFILSQRISSASIYSKINLILFFISIIHLILTFKCIYLVPPVSISLYDSNSKDMSAEFNQKMDKEFKTEKISSSDRNINDMLSSLPVNQQHQYDTVAYDDSMQLDPPESLSLKTNSEDTHLHSDLSCFSQEMKSPFLLSRTFESNNTQQLNKGFNLQKENSMFKSKANVFEIDQKEDDNKIAPQRFFAPEQPTGLEAIFSPALRLEDEPLIIRALRIVKRRKLNWSEVISILLSLEIIIINILNLGKYSYYSSIIGSFGIACSIGSNSLFLKKTYIKLTLTGAILSFFYYLYIYISHYDDNFEIFLQTSRKFLLCNALIISFYFCHSLRILWIIQSFWDHKPSKVKQKVMQKHQNRTWGNYAYSK